MLTDKLYTVSLYHKILAAIFLLAACTITTSYLLNSADYGILDDATSVYPLLLEHAANGTVSWDSMHARPAGPLGRIVPVATFIAEINWFGHTYEQLKITNVVLHFLLATSLVLAVCVGYRNGLHESTISVWLMFGVLFWFVNPYWISTVQYTVQRMTLMAAFFGVWAMLLHLAAILLRKRNKPIKSIFLYIGSCFCLVIAVFSKENTLAIVLLLVLLEMVFISNQRDRRAAVLISSLAAICLVVIGWEAYSDWISNGYLDRDFTLYERLRTQLTMTFRVAGQLILPWKVFPTVFTDYVLVTPISETLYAFSVVLGVSIICCVVSLLHDSMEVRLAGYSFLAFLVLLVPENTVIALELHFQHRYYLPSLFLFLGFALLVHLSSKMARELCGEICYGGVRHLARCFGALYLLLALVSFLTNIINWKSPILLSLEAVQRVSSPRAASSLADYLSASGFYPEALYYSRLASSIDEQETQWDLVFRNSMLACKAEATFSRLDHALNDVPGDYFVKDVVTIRAFSVTLQAGYCDRDFVESWYAANRQAIRRALSSGVEVAYKGASQSAVIHYLDYISDDIEIFDFERLKDA